MVTTIRDRTLEYIGYVNVVGDQLSEFSHTQHSKPEKETYGKISE
jgi:hypothetical protein